MQCLSPPSESTSVKLTLQLSKVYSLTIAPGNIASHAHHVAFEPLITFQGRMIHETLHAYPVLGEDLEAGRERNCQAEVVMIEFFS